MSVFTKDLIMISTYDKTYLSVKCIIYIINVTFFLDLKTTNILYNCFRQFEQMNIVTVGFYSV